MIPCDIEFSRYLQRKHCASYDTCWTNINQNKLFFEDTAFKVSPVKWRPKYHSLKMCHCIFKLNWHFRRTICLIYDNPNHSRFVKKGPVSITHNPSYCKIPQSLEVARFVFRIALWLENLTGASAVLLPMCLWNFKAIRTFEHSMSRLRDFTRSHDKMSYWILKVYMETTPEGLVYLSARWFGCTLSNPPLWGMPVN